VPGNATLTVTHAGVSASQTITIAAVAPALFTIDGSNAAALNQNYTVNSASHPAKAGQAIILFGTGQGPVSPPVSTGAAAGSEPLSRVPPSSASATIGGVKSTVLFAGMAPGYAGLLQVNLVVPSGLQGAEPVIVTSPGWRVSRSLYR